METRTAKIKVVGDLSKYDNITCSMTQKCYGDYDIRDLELAIFECDYLLYDLTTNRLYETTEYDYENLYKEV